MMRSASEQAMSEAAEPEFACWICAGPLARVGEADPYACTLCGEVFPDICTACQGPYRAEPANAHPRLCEPCAHAGT